MTITPTRGTVPPTITEAPTSRSRPGRKHTRLPTWLVASGIFFVVIALVFFFVGIPALVRLPLTTNQTAYYTGRFTEYVNQQTLLPLATPLTVPMTVERTVKVTSGSFSTAVITEDDIIRPASLTYRQDFQYLINRRSIAFENGPQTKMFGQRAPVDIAGTYRVNFPLGTTASGRYPVWNTETDTATVVTDGRGPHTMKGVSGVQVIDFNSSVKAPVSSYYYDWLMHNGFPSVITPSQVQSRLVVLGVNVSSLITDVLPQLTPAQQAVVEKALATPIPLDYNYFYSGIVSVEPHTGILISVDTTAEGIKVSPSPKSLSELQPILAQYSSLPGVAALSSALEVLETPQLAVEYQYVQTPASAQHMANLAKSQIRTMDVLGDLPWIVGGIGLLLSAWGIGLSHRRHRTPVTVSRPEGPSRMNKTSDGGES